MGQLLGWLGFAITVGCYAAATRLRRLSLLHWGNAVGCIPLTASAIAIRGWPQLAMSVTWGAIGWWGLLAQRPRAFVPPPEM